MSGSFVGTSSQSSLELPPGPDLPAWESAKLWIEHPVQFWKECASQYGDTFTVDLGSLGKVVLFSDPEAVRQIFQLPSSTFPNAPYNEHYKHVMGARSVLLSDGPNHLQKRKWLMPSLHRQLVERHGESIRGLAREAIASWSSDQPFSPRPSMHLFSLKLILRVFFGSADEGLGRAIADIFSQEIYHDLTSWGPWTRFGHLQPRLRVMIDEEVRRRREHFGAGDLALLDALVQARDEAGEPLANEEIQDHLFTMLVGGADPTALALSWASTGFTSIRRF